MGVNTKIFDNASDMITFSRASGGYGLTKVSYGPELVTNGDFSTDSDWTKGGSWTISSGVATQPSGASAEYLVQADILTIGKVYEYSVEVTSANGSNFPQLYTEAGAIKSFGSGADTYTGIFVAAGNDVRIRGVSPTLDVSVDNISVKEVTYNSSAADATLQLTYHPNDVPRIEYNTDGTSKGLLVEEARTNLFTNSDAIDSTLAGLQNITPSDVEITSGVYQGTWRKFTEDTATARHRLLGTFVATIPANSYATVSCLVKNISGTRNVGLVVYTGGDNFQGDFDLDAETSSVSKGGTGVAGTSTIENLGSGIYRISVSGIVSTTATNCGVIFRLADGLNIIYTGDGTSSIAVTGMQIEQGAFRTSLIKTTGATATRSLDLAEINVSNFINKSAGTFLATFNYSDPTNADNNYVFSGSSNARVFYNNAGNSVWQTYDGNAGTTFGDVDSGEVYKLAVAVKTDSNISTAKNGTIQTTRTVNTALMTSIEAYPLLAIGGASSSSSYQKLNGHIKSITYYPRRLTDAQLQELTT